MSRIFISYRHDDTAADMTDRIYERLVRRWGRRVFMDIDSLMGGDVFAKAIEDNLHTCSVVLVIIGREWVSLKDEQGSRRIDDPGDYPRMEVAAALRRSIRVIPVLVGSAQLPKREELPDDLRALVDREFVRVTREHFDGDVRRLIQAIASELPVDRWRTMPRRAVGIAALLAAFATAAYFVFSDSGRNAMTAGVSERAEPKPGDANPNAVASGPGVAAGSRAAAADAVAGVNGTTDATPRNESAHAAATVAQNKPNHDDTTSPATGPDVSGKWQTDYMKSPYDDSRYKLTFDFVQQEDMLVGTVSEVIEGRGRAVERRIVDGRIRKNVLNFYTEGQVWYDSKLQPYKEAYTGVLDRKTNTIAFQRANDSPGGGDVEKFVAKRD